MMPAMGERELGGKTCLITGANSGIGRAAARELARRGARVVIACRSARRGGEAVEAIRGETASDEVELLVLDLADLSSVRAAASEFLERHQALHILINNAGVAGQRGLTRDGFELAFGINHLGHFLLTHLLLDRLRESAPARVVNVSSSSHYSAKSIDWQALAASTASITGLPEYGVSKLANVLFTAELARRLEGSGVTTYAVHPGVIASEIWRRIPFPFRQIGKAFMRSNDEGAETVVYCAASANVAGETGLYYAKCATKTPSRLANDEQLAAELWRRSEDFCELDVGESRATST
jgi:retinol dehydrogenase 12